MNFKNNATYRFICRADKNRSLNVYGDSGSVPSAQTNVCLYTSNANDTCQQWIYKESGGNKYFVCKKNPNLALDMYTGSTSGQTNVNAHVYTASNTSYLAFEDTDSDYIKIRLSKYSNKYLTANQGDNGTNTGRTTHDKGNVYWYAGGLTDHSQEWKPVLVDEGSAPDPDPTVRQKLILPLNKTKLTASYKNATYKQTYGVTHYGIDQISSVGSTTIYASGTGTLITKGWDEHAGYVVVIKYPGAYHHTTGKYEDVIFRYYHLNSINSNIPTGVNKITKDTILGQYGGSGMGEMNHWNFHLHVEADTDTGAPCYSPTFKGSGSIIKGADSGATDSTCHSALEYLHCKTSAPDNQSYTTTGDSYINSGDRTIPKI